MSNNLSIKVACDLHLKSKKQRPVYRAYVNDELFVERTWIWPEGFYLQEYFQISSDPGIYHIWYEPLDPSDTEIKTQNWRVEHGPARIIKGSQFEILGDSI